MKSILSLAAHDYQTALCRMEDATHTLAARDLAEPRQVETLRRALGVVRLLAEGIVEDRAEASGSLGLISQDRPVLSDSATEVLRP